MMGTSTPQDPSPLPQLSTALHRQAHMYVEGDGERYDVIHGISRILALFHS